MSSHFSRRTFIKNTAIATTGISLLGCRTLGQTAKAPELAVQPLKILILGGTSFLGPHQVAYALGRGHSVTTFTRGKTKPTVNTDLFEDVEMLIGDRIDNLEALKNRKWDVVIDNSGREVQWTRDTADLLKDNVEQYVYISSVSVYYPYYITNIKEDQSLVLEIPKDLEEGEKPLYDYGVMKANSEIAAREIFGEDRTIVVRPTFMTGPGDRTDRFMYWPIQLSRGGDILVPGTKDDQIQFIDIRDIAGWMIRLVEQKAAGTYNGSGPAHFTNISTYVEEGAKGFDESINPIFVDDYDFLREQEVSFIAPWILPSEKFAGISNVSIQKALATGITYRSITDTIKDTHDWWISDAVTEERRLNYMTNENEMFQRAPKIVKQWFLR